jgi:lycopene beta-cyclase
MRVALIDPSPLAPWLNNYGVWCDEFKALGFDDCYRAVWNKARVVIDETDVEGKMLDRAYAQVDRKKLKAKLFARTLKQGVEFGAAAVESCDNSSSSHSIVTLSDGRKVFAKMVLDATGHSRKLVEFDRDFTPGYQAAFGIVATVEKHPFPLDTMLFMDWRDEHLSPKFKEQNDRLPTFLYAMPFSETEVFLEETSLVARPGLDFRRPEAQAQGKTRSPRGQGDGGARGGVLPHPNGWSVAYVSAAHARHWRNGGDGAPEHWLHGGQDDALRSNFGWYFG